MSAVLSIRIPKELKEEMEKLKDFVDWKKEIISFIEERVAVYRRVATLRKARRIFEKHPTLPRGYAAASVREDRDSG